MIKRVADALICHREHRGHRGIHAAGDKAFSRLQFRLRSLFQDDVNKILPLCSLCPLWRQFPSGFVDEYQIILPTQGENFGHAIFESLGVGTPVIISDRTIWRGLQEQQAGWDLPLEEPGMLAGAVRELGSMDLPARERLRAGALELAQEFMRKNRFLEEYLKVFFGEDAEAGQGVGVV